MPRPDTMVREFHESFDLPVHEELRVLSGEELNFRRTLIQEEYEELMEALDGDDLAHQMKEAADLIYVLFGWDQHAGNRLWEVFEEVHASNMTKLWPCPDCTNGLELHMNNDVRDCSTCGGGGKVVKYREDGKVLKPPTYTPPDLSGILDGHTR